MIRRPPRSTLDRSSAASDVYKRQVLSGGGVRGAAHAGVLNALQERGIKPEAISATSAGAIVGAMIADAVSYTHLRAHETVLDLVCRLLLEKKKKMKEYKKKSLPYNTQLTSRNTRGSMHNRNT